MKPEIALDGDEEATEMMEREETNFGISQPEKDSYLPQPQPEKSKSSNEWRNGTSGDTNCNSKKRQYSTMDTKDEDSFDEDPTVLAYRRAKVGPESNCPPKIKMSTTPTAICFHPENDMIVVSTFNAEINMFSYTNTENTQTLGVKHQNYCRELKFSLDGEKLFGAMNDKYMLIYDVEYLQLERAVTGASKGYASSFVVIDEHVLAIGDDDGVVNFWDKRCQSRAMKFEVASDAVTSMLCDPTRRSLVTTSSDGTISTIKIRGGKIDSKSEIYPYSMNCSGLVRQNTKLAVGDADGRLVLFNWGEFYSHSDIHTSNGTGINRLVPVTEHIVITGCDNGQIKATYLYPHEVIGEVGDHNKTPIEEN